MSRLRETLARLPADVRYALIKELQDLNGYQPTDMVYPGEEALLDALLSLTEGQVEKRRRVVITGLGAITPVGNSAPATWESLVAGRSGITRVTRFDVSPYPSQVGGEVKDFDPTPHIPAKEARRMARCSQIAVCAAHEAVADSGLDLSLLDPTRVGVILGTGVGGLELYRDMIWRASKSQEVRMKASPSEAINGLANMPAFHVSQAFGTRGPLNTVVTACAAGTQALGLAAQTIRLGTADIMLAGGVEAMVHELFYAAFTAMRAVTTHNEVPERASRPFDATRDGFVISEGSAMMVLESLDHALARGAKIYAEVLGWSETSDAYHMAQPDPEAKGAALAMRRALADGGLQPAEVDYINAHAAGTPLGDAAETRAIKQVFGERAYQIPISSTKSMIGHLFGGAGAAEALACVYAVYTDTIHPTINYEYPDPECDLDYVPNQARRTPVDVALSNSFGLGGQNASLIVGKYRP